MSAACVDASHISPAQLGVLHLPAEGQSKCMHSALAAVVVVLLQCGAGRPCRALCHHFVAARRALLKRMCTRKPCSGCGGSPVVWSRPTLQHPQHHCESNVSMSGPTIWPSCIAFAPQQI
eukprot:363762-Chlamydomonas_euryale.AAC.6